MSAITPYAELYANPKGVGDGRPTALKVVEDQELTDGLVGKVILITGCSAGIGVETAKALETTGATLYLTARNLDKARQALGSLAESTRVHLLELNLESLASVRSCADNFLKQSDRLDVLINNAGVRKTPFGRTQDGFETQFGVNHIAHFLLFQLLKPTLLASSTPEHHSRVIALSSSDHREMPGKVDMGDPNYTKNPKSYSPDKGYTQSKLANIYMTNEINRRYASRGLNANAVMPGGIMTGLQQGNNRGVLKELLLNPKLLLIAPRTNKLMKSAEQGAATSVWGAVGKELEGKGGFYLEDCGVSGPMKDSAAGIDPGYGRLAMDEEAAKKLWDLSCDLVGIEDRT